MSKKILSVLLITILTISVFSSVYALDGGIDTQEELIQPRALACMYWPDGYHKLNTGTTTTNHVYQYSQIHLIEDEFGGIIDSYTDFVCKIYNVTESYCACGYTTSKSIYSSTHCH